MSDELYQSSVTIDAATSLRWSEAVLAEADAADAAWYEHYRAKSLRRWWPLQRWLLRREPTEAELNYDVRREHWVERHSWSQRDAAETLLRLSRNAEDGHTITVTAALIKELERRILWPPGVVRAS